jgi:hypothetical protein
MSKLLKSQAEEKTRFKGPQANSIEIIRLSWAWKEARDSKFQLKVEF